VSLASVPAVWNLRPLCALGPERAPVNRSRPDSTAGRESGPQVNGHELVSWFQGEPQ
jgi:hypothetical protein